MLIILLGDGYCRSEGVVALYVQKLSSARRSYLKILDVLENCDGYTEQGKDKIKVRSSSINLNMLQYLPILFKDLANDFVKLS